MAGVRLEHLTKRYAGRGGSMAVRDVTLDIPDRQFCVLVGPSGCGKSTTIRLIAGLEEATEGDIYIDGQRVNDRPPKDRDIAMVFQNYALYPHMTAAENMSFGLRIRRYPRKEIEARVREAAEMLGLTPLLDRRPKAMSGGERQRVAVGRAIVRKPKVFLFDEPLSNLDAKLRVQMRGELKKLHERLQTTMIYVTHDQVEAMTMGDKIVVMKGGVIQQEGAPLAIYDHPRTRFVAGFIGSPSMNFFDCRVVRREAGWFLDEGRMALRVPEGVAPRVESCEGKDVVFGIRPEDIYDRMVAASASPDTTARATVEVIEPMGAEVFLRLTTGRHPFTVRVGVQHQAVLNQEMEVVFNMHKMHLYDLETEEVIV